MAKKVFAVLLCFLLLGFAFFPTGVFADNSSGQPLTDDQKIGVLSLIAGTYGIVFQNAADMKDACRALLQQIADSTSAYVLEDMRLVNDMIVLEGNYVSNGFQDLVSAVRDFFNPGDNVSFGGSGVSITNLGQIYQGSGVPPADSDVARFSFTESPVNFVGADGSDYASVSVVMDNYGGTPGSLMYYRFVVSGQVDTAPFGSTSSGTSVFDPYIPYCFFSVKNGRVQINFVTSGAAYGYGNTDFIYGSYLTPIVYSLVTGVSGGGEVPVDIPVFQEAGALLIPAINDTWGNIQTSAAQNNGGISFSTSAPAYTAGSTGEIGGSSAAALVDPQSSSLSGVGVSETVVDSSTGEVSQVVSQTGSQSVPDSDSLNPSMEDMQTKTKYNGDDLTLDMVFPFCIPFDVYYMIRGLAVPREPIQFDWRLYLPSFIDYTYTFDFSDWEPYANVLRICETAAFAIGLAAATRKFIKW